MAAPFPRPRHSPVDAATELLRCLPFATLDQLLRLPGWYDLLGQEVRSHRGLRKAVRALLHQAGLKATAVPGVPPSFVGHTPIVEVRLLRHPLEVDGSIKEVTVPAPGCGGLLTKTIYHQKGEIFAVPGVPGQRLPSLLLAQHRRFLDQVLLALDEREPDFSDSAKCTLHYGERLLDKHHLSTLLNFPAVSNSRPKDGTERPKQPEPFLQSVRDSADFAYQHVTGWLNLADVVITHLSRYPEISRCSVIAVDLDTPFATGDEVPTRFMPAVEYSIRGERALDREWANIHMLIGRAPWNPETLWDHTRCKDPTIVQGWRIW